MCAMYIWKSNQPIERAIFYGLRNVVTFFSKLIILESGVLETETAFTVGKRKNLHGAKYGE